MKKILTLGPASADPRTIERLLRTADMFRLNASHLDSESLAAWLQKLTHVFKKSGREIPVVLDLQGAKMRVGSYPTVESLPERVTLTLAESSQTPDVVPVPHPEVFTQVGEGEELHLNDARVSLRVEKRSADKLSCRTVRNGPLSAHKGLNRPTHPIRYAELTRRDREAILQAREFSFVEFAFSFVLDGHEAALLRPHVAGKRIAAKLELVESLDHLEAIDAGFDSLWLCRGDMGSQAGLRALGELQNRFEMAFPRLKKPRILAGQVLEHMTSHPEPTRSEVVHLWDVREAGFDAIVLSDETAIGRHVDAVADFLDEFFR